ncbi:hypothetical protein [Deinococcus hopiensis]|uniref:hypothetical protein n=1 Tax=Deinococcus hopiensis TaxID=309885 RepID=UPI00111C2FD3|nr:hypothetical protein [Deinococcus hopiensis]
MDRVFRKHHITRKKTLAACERIEERREPFLHDSAPDVTRAEQAGLPERAWSSHGNDVGVRTCSPF